MIARRARTTSATILAVMLMCSRFAPPASAGNNAGGTATLSWSAGATVSNLSAVPLFAVPLFVHLDGATDVEELAVNIHWTPAGAAGAAYHVLPADSGIGACGWTHSIGDNLVFDGDSTYTSGIIFPTSNHDCFAYMVTVDDCDGAAASFCLTSVTVVDRNGLADKLQIEGNATILGGIPEGCPALVRDVFPHTVVAGQPAALTITGDNLLPSTRVSLLRADGTLLTASTAPGTQHELTSTVEVPIGLTGPLSLVVGPVETYTDTLPGRINAVAAPTATYDHHSILVWFRSGAVTLPAGSTGTNISAASYGSPSLATLLTSVGAQDIRMLTPTATLENLAGLDTSQLDMYTLTLGDTNVASAITTLSADTAHVIEAAPNWVRGAMTVPNDPSFPVQWCLQNSGQYGGVPGKDVQASSAWDFAPSGPQVDVVVLDTGSDPSHPELSGRVLYGPSFIPYVSTSYDDARISSHGTSVSGIIAAQGNNSLGIAGVDWTARIIAVKVLDSLGYTYANSDAAGVDWARTNGYRIVNMSLGGDGWSRAEYVLYKNAYMSGMAIFASSGNLDGQHFFFPAAYGPFVVAVGAMLYTGNRWSDWDVRWNELFGRECPNQDCYYFGSTYGSQLRFVAPGGRFVKTTRSVATGSYWPLSPVDTLDGFGGTSAAAPVAAGVAALVQSAVHPQGTQLTGEDLVTILVRTAHRIPPPIPGYPEYGNWNMWTGVGSINADSAVAMVASPRLVEHGQATVVYDAGQSNAGTRTIEDWPGLSPGIQAAVRHRVRARLHFSTPFSDPPVVWARSVSSYGAGDEDSISFNLSGRASDDTTYRVRPWTPTAWVVESTQDSVILETYVYQLGPVGSQHWWPTIPDSVRLAYTAIGPVYVAGVKTQTQRSQVLLTALPNPARGQCWFRVVLPRGGAIRLRVYDIAGHLVKELESLIAPAGTHTVLWDLTTAQTGRARAGLYFAKLESTSGNSVARVIALR